MLHFAYWTGIGWGVDPRGPPKNPAWRIYSRGGSIASLPWILQLKGGVENLNKMLKWIEKGKGGLTSYHNNNMRTANIRNAQELKSVNAKESAALAQAFVSKEFLEVQVEKGNIDDVLTAITVSFWRLLVDDVQTLKQHFLSSWLVWKEKVARIQWLAEFSGKRFFAKTY